MKHLNIKNYVDDFKTLPLFLVYSFEDPNEQLDTLSNLKLLWQLFTFLHPRYHPKIIRHVLKNKLKSKRVFIHIMNYE